MITGFFDPRYGWPVPRVRVFIFLSDVTSNWVPIDFLLDTGASTTCLHPRDTIFLVGINPVRLAQPQYWPQREEHGGVGGTATYFVLPAFYAFWHGDQQRWQQMQGQIRIAQLRSDNQTLESLLGWDLLQLFSVSVDWANRQITLQ